MQCEVTSHFSTGQNLLKKILGKNRINKNNRKKYEENVNVDTGY